MKLLFLVLLCAVAVNAIRDPCGLGEEFFDQIKERLPRGLPQKFVTFDKVQNLLDRCAANKQSVTRARDAWNTTKDSLVVLVTVVHDLYADMSDQYLDFALERSYLEITEKACRDQNKRYEATIKKLQSEEFTSTAMFAVIILLVLSPFGLFSVVRMLRSVFTRPKTQ